MMNETSMAHLDVLDKVLLQGLRTLYHRYTNECSSTAYVDTYQSIKLLQQMHKLVIWLRLQTLGMQAHTTLKRCPHWGE